MLWYDGTNRIRTVICIRTTTERKMSSTGSSNGFVENSLLLCGKKLSMSYGDYHDDMSGIVFKNWFENMLTENLPKKGK